MRPKLAALVAAVLTAVASGARADCEPRVSTCLSTDALWPKPGPQRFAFAASPEITAPGNFGLALVSTYQKRPLDLHVATPGPTGTSTPVVDNQIDATLLASFGIVDRLAAFVAMPATLFQDGAGAGPVTGRTLSPGGLRDPRFGVGAALVRGERFAVASYAEAQIPTGSTADFDGERGFAFAPTVAAMARFFERITIGADLGARVRTAPQSFFGARQATQVSLALGAGIDVLPKLSFGLEARSLGDLEPRFGGEWLASVRTAFSPLSLMAGGGGTLPLGGLAGIGRVRAVLGVAYTPR